MLVLEKLVAANASGHDALSPGIIHEPQKVTVKLTSPVTSRGARFCTLACQLLSLSSIRHYPKLLEKTCMYKLIRERDSTV
jgi:hypothetical protein